MRALLVAHLICFISFQLIGQTAETKEAVTFEELYDEPYAINKLFIGFQPFYADVFATNINAGFGGEVQYFYQDKFDIKAHFRKTYSSKFFDFNREVAIRNSVTVIQPEIYNYYEIGGTYHIQDFDVASTTKIYLHKKNFSANRWAATVPSYAEVPSKVRKIYGLRAGAIIWNSTTDLSRVLDKQGLSNSDLRTASNTSLPDTYSDNSGTQNLIPFSNLYSTNIYLGGSMSWFRNVAVSFDKYDEGMDDGMLTLFFDIMLAPSLHLDPVIYNNEEYATDAVKLSKIGVRAGIDGRFNRSMSWSYGGEVGYRPSVSGRSFFALIKVAFPVFSSNLENKVEAFSK